MDQKIIGLSGRKQSGKSELSNVCLEFGFEIYNFAGALKLLLANYMGISIEKLNKDKEVLQKIVVDASYLSSELNVPLALIEEHLNGGEFSSIRHALQFIGTQLIRKLCPRWHIDQVRKKIQQNPNVSIVIDDLRFKDELECLRSFNAECWYIVRPSTVDISNHESETGLTWADFGDNVIINNISLPEFRNKWGKHLEESIILPQVMGKKQDFLGAIKNLYTYSSGQLSQKITCTRDKIARWFSMPDHAASRENYFYDPTAFLHPSSEASYYAGLLMSGGFFQVDKKNNDVIISFENADKTLVDSLKAYMKSDSPLYKRWHPGSDQIVYSFDCNSPYVLQNLKWWNITPQNDKVPDIIRNDEQNLKNWTVGLIDGGGRSYITYDKCLEL